MAHLKTDATLFNSESLKRQASNAIKRSLVYANLMVLQQAQVSQIPYELIEWRESII